MKPKPNRLVSWMRELAEWGWQSAALGRVRARPRWSEHQRCCERYAKQALGAAIALAPEQGATRVQEPMHPASRGRMQGAVSLLREAAYWAILANFPEPGAAESLAEAMALPLVQQLPDADAARQALVERGFRETAQGSEDLLRRDLAVSFTFVRALLQSTREPVKESTAIRRRRVWVVLGATALVGAMVVLGWKGRGARPDLLAQAKWEASSASWGLPRTGVGGSTYPADLPIVFHTSTDDSPWIRFDLGAPKTFSTATIVNRLDAERDRAVPLVLEVSVDGERWVPIAHQARVFDTWTAEFAPQTARHFRVRLSQRGILHLSSMQLR